jgi:predicted dehydrogenase
MHVGILGGGLISDTHARAVSAISGASVSAVYGANLRKATRLAEAAGAAAYDDLDRFLAHRPMDLVAIGSPSGLHAEHGMAAIHRGLHVLIEKPLDISTARIDRLIEAAAGRDVKVGVFFQDRLKPDVLRMKSHVVEGRLGTPVLASGRVKWHRPAEYFADSRWRGTWRLDGGGALMNQAIHTLDLLLWLFGPLARVAAYSATRIHRIEVEDTVTAILEFASGALGVLEASTCVFPGYPRRLELTGSEGTLVLEGDNLIRIDLRSGGAVLESSGGAPAANASSPAVADARAHQRVFEDFMSAIRANGTPACDAREGRKSVEAAEAIYRSAREGGPVALQVPASA